MSKKLLTKEQNNTLKTTTISREDRHTLLRSWNDTDTPYPMDKTLAQLFEEQVDKTPNNIALVFAEQKLTYRQLNEKANQLAHVIRAHYQNNNSHGIKADTLIGLYLDRSLEMVISILGVLKAGGAYVPISPEYPQLRAQFMFEDTQTSLIITQPHYKQQLNNWIDELDITPTMLAIDDVSDDNSTANLAAINGPKDLAYVIYTSGTTGKPKGVMVQHSGVVNRIVWMQQKYPLSSSSRVLQKTPYIFDVSVWELLWGNLTGATIIIAAPEIHKEPDKLNELIIKSGVTTLHFVPSMFASFCDYLQQLQLSFPKNVQQVFCSGEALTVSHVDRFIKTNHDSTLLTNLYGPTEVSIDVTYFDIIESTNKFIPIGRPISNTQVYVLNKQQNLAAIGATGELYIGGAGLARGYLNQPELTGERFIENPFATPDDKAKGYNRLYKTGDLVRWRSDGNLEYLGRNDCQVKIRGYRIELGEIESALSALKGVKQAVVVDFENNGHKYLAAYLIKASGMGIDIDIDIEIDIEACRDSLALKLPDYMLPTTFTVLDSIPLTINGKLDRKSLPIPEFVNADKYVAARNELEEQLCNIWQEVLSVKKVGIDDNFFRIGGDSIVSIGLVSKMRREGFSLQVKDIFDAPTVAQLGCLLNSKATRIKIKTEQGVLTGGFDLLPIQSWFFVQKLAKPQYFNQAFIIKIPGMIKYTEIEQALQVLTDQHDMLRCVFLEKASSKTKSYQQQYRDNIDGMCEPLYALNIADLNSEELDEKLTQLQSKFSYINGPTWQAAHLTGHIDGRARLFFAFHHLIMDVVSWRIIAQDIKQLLTKPLLSKQALTKQALPPKGSSYRQWVRAVQHYALNHQDERAYWQGVCADQAGLPALGAVAYYKVSLSVHQTDVLLHQANFGFHTQINDLLLSALAISLFEVLGSDVNHVTLEGHGREVIDATLDVSNTVGWFTSMYPVRLEAHNTISATIIQTKEMLSAVPHKGIGYGALHKQQAFAMSLPKIIFNYLGQLGAQSDNEESSNWQVSQEDAGQMIANDNTDHLLVNINGAVQAGILTFNIASRLSSVLTKEFEAHFHSALVEVIEQAALKAKSGGVNTPSDYAVKGLSIDHLDFLQRRLTTNKIAAIFPANSLQQGFISHHLHYPEDDAYRVQLLLDYNEALDLNCYQQAWSLASLRYPALRACFDWRDGLVQIITADSSINLDNFTLKDISHLPQAARAQEIIKIQQLDRKVQFDLSTPGLMRFTIIKQHANLVTVMQTTHHSISDGWSVPILLQQVHEYYNQLVVGMQVQIKVDRAFVNAQHYYIKAKSAALDHWKKAKEQFQAGNDLNLLLTTTVDLAQLKTIVEPCSSELSIKGDLYKKLKQMCQNQAITLNVAVQFAWHKLLHIYSGDEQTIVGTTVAGRDLPVDGIESSVGLYINTLPLTVDWDNSISVSAILNNIQKSIAELNSYSNVCLADLQSNGQRLFHSLFVFENYPSPIDTNTSGIENHLTFRAAIEKTDYPLSVTAYEENESLVVKLHYSEEWLRQNKARRLLNQIQLILASIAKNTDQSHQQISLLDDCERNTLLHTWNDTYSHYPMDKTIWQLFEEQVDKTPNNVALVFEEESLTYSQLNQRANQLAHAIRAYYQNKNSQGIKADTLIGLYLDRSLDMVISILGVLKAGGAYVPISPEYPQLRVRFMLDDTQTSLVITQQHYKPQLNNWSAKLDITPTLLAIDDVSDDNPIVNLEPISTSKDLAYVIYTSGTTGTPKGVLQLHTNVVSLFESTDKYFQFTHKDTWVLFHEYTFDFSVWELWGALLYGGQLIIPTKSLTQDTCKFVQLCVNSQVTILNQTPAAFYLFIEESLSAAAKFPCLRNVIFGGDKLNLSLLKPWWNCYAQDAPLLVNMYGITETTVHVTYKSLSPKNNLKAANIGKPLNDLKAFVLNTQKNLVPIGAPGELYIGGAGLARGYLNQAELTNERFIDNPFATTDDKAKGYNRLYKTGDLVRWRDDGNLEYLGRNDCQVKIRGYRIELGEIESALSALKDVKHAVVVDLEKDGHKYLAAYLIKASSMVSDIDIDIDIEACRDSLALKLPDYMLPATFTVLDSIPLTINGKLDRRALPTPEFVSADNYVAPRNELEEQLCNIWQEVLNVKKVGIADNFFRIGGDSIIAIRVIAKMKLLGKSFFVADLFSYPTVAGVLSKAILTTSKVKYIPFSLLKSPQLKRIAGLGYVNLVDAYPATYLQMGMLLESSRSIGTYHDVFHYQIRGKLDAALLTKLLQGLVNRHEALRTTFIDDQLSGYIALVLPHLEVDIDFYHADNSSRSLVEREHQKSFSAVSGALSRFIISDVQAKYFRLTFSFHHAIMDGWSVASMMSELCRAYVKKSKNLVMTHSMPLYGEFARNERFACSNANIQTFWVDYLASYEEPNVSFFKDAKENTSQVKSKNYSLSNRECSAVLELSNSLECTVDNVFLTLLHHILCLLQNTRDVVIGLVVNNRLEVEGGDQLLGLFLNTIPFRYILPVEESDVYSRIQNIVAEKNKLLNYKSLPFAFIKSKLLNNKSLYHCVFNYVHFHIADDVDNNNDSVLLGRGGYEKTNNPLTLSVSRSNNNFDLRISSLPEAVDDVFLEQLFIYFKENLKMLSIEHLNISKQFINITKKDCQSLRLYNDTHAPYPMDKTIAQLFEEQVDKTPNNIAIVFEGEELTYIQLNNKANQLAHAIRAHYQNNNSQGIKADTLIGLYLDRSLDMVISILGVLKAGGAYVPISPEYPQLRAQYILGDTQASLIITQPHYKKQLTKWTAKLDITPTLLALDDVSDDNPTANLAAINGAKDLAYVIYTSGTTGKPKGVMIEHKNVVNYLYALTEHVGDLFNRVDFSANYCFDLSITTNLCPLLVGSCIYIFGKNISDIESYLQHIRANEIDFVKTTPSLASVIFANTEIKVKTLLLGGEILSKQCVAQLSNNVDVICDEYGPTESTVGALIANVLPLMSKGIGKSYSNIKLYNLSPSLSLLPIGTPGELYIGGAGLARGYLNQEELTGERFIDNPFATPDDKAKGYDRLYKTGDRVRWAHDGNLEYLGRNDCQVKIRGYRIELGEIESALSALKDVKQAVVVDLENDGNKYIAAYLIKASSMAIDIDIEACRDSLALKLPDYMLPSTFTVLDSIPLTINGKLDRRALPTPEFISTDKYVAARNELEEQLCNIWQEVLGVKRVGIDDNFFRIGGDSIVSIGLVSKMRREGFSLQVKDIFDAPTVAQLSRLLNESNTRIKIKTEQGVLTGAFDLLPIQAAFFAQKLAKPQHFNQSFIIKIPGEIKYAEIENSLQALTDQHDMLRCVFLKKASSKTKSYQQQYRDNIDGMCEPLYALNIAGLNSEELDEKLTQLQSNFSYIKGPTWQAAHLTGHRDGCARLFFAFHHLIIDVVSWRIIAQDIKQLLTKQLLTKQLLTKQLLTKQALPPKGSSYRQWVRAVQHYALNHQDERAYWQGVCTDQAGLPALGTVAYHTVSLSVEQTDILLHQANLGFHTQINDLLLSALAISLFEVFGSDVNHVTLEGHGREVIDETLDVSNTVGWFTSMYPVRLKAHNTISATIIHTKEMLSAVPHKGIGYGALHQQQAFAMSLPKISFNYLGQLGAQSDNEESSTWQISQEDAGQMIASDNTEHLLVNINGAVQGGILTFNIASRLSSILTDAFEEHFHSALVEVIEQAALKAKNGGVNTPSDYAVKGLSIDHLDFLERRLTTNKIAEIFPANSLQQGFISHHLHYPEDDAYRVQLLLDYNEALDLNCYQQAWSLASQRYPALRACFDWRDGLVQIITADSSINLDNFTLKDISHLPQAARAQEIIKIQKLDRKVPFDLSTPGLMRFTLIKQHAKLVTVMQTTHHSISDGWSGPILLQQVHEYYNQLVLGMQVQIKVERAFVNAQHYYIKEKSAALDHWKKAKERFQAANDLNFLFTTPVDLAQLKTIAEPCASELIIKGDLYKQLKQMCQNQAITLNVALQFAWHKLLHIYSGDEQTIVGTTVSGRDLPVDGIESSVGLYINTLPLTVDWDNSISVSAILNNIQKSIAELNSYSNVCLADLQTNGQRLFHSLFVFENYPSPIDTNTSGIENHLTFRAAIEKTDYPLSVTAYEKNESLVVKLHYSEEWLRQNQARRLLNQIQLILASIAKNTDHSHQQISLMDDLERHTLYILGMIP